MTVVARSRALNIIKRGVKPTRLPLKCRTGSELQLTKFEVLRACTPVFAVPESTQKIRAQEI